MPHSPARRQLLLSIAVLGSTLCHYPLLTQAQDNVPPADAAPVVFQPQVPYAKDADISDAIRQQCRLSEAMVASIQKYAGEYGWPLASDEPASAQPGGKARRLSAEISHATPGLYAFSHWHTKPATLTVHFRLTDGGTVVLDSYRSCSSRKAGFLGLDGRACSKLLECADEQGDYIGKWVKKTLYR